MHLAYPETHSPSIHYVYVLLDTLHKHPTISQADFKIKLEMCIFDKKQDKRDIWNHIFNTLCFFCA